MFFTVFVFSLEAVLRKTSITFSVLLWLFCTVPVLCMAIPGEILWSCDLSGYIYGSNPAINQNATIFIGSYDDSLHAVSAEGNQLWAVDLGGNIIMAPTVLQDGNICCASMTDTLFCISDAGGVIWKQGFDADLTNIALRKDGTLLVGISSGMVHHIDSEGNFIADFSCGDALEKGPFIAADGSVICYTTDQIKVFSRQFALRWHDDAYTSIPPAIVGNWIYFRGGFYNFITRRTDGTLLNTIHDFNSDYGTGDLVDADGSRYFTTQYGCLVKYSSSGTYCWHHVFSELFAGVPVLDADGNIMVGTNSGGFFCLDADGQMLWSTTLPSKCTASPKIMDNGTIVLGCYDGEVVCIQGNGQPQAPLGYPCVGGDLENSHSTDTPLYAQLNTLSFPYATAGIPSVDTLYVFNGDTEPKTVELSESSPYFGAGLAGTPVIEPGDSVAVEIVFFTSIPLEENAVLTIHAAGTQSAFYCMLHGNARQLENGMMLSHIAFPGDHTLSSSLLLGSETVITGTGEEIVATNLDGDELWRTTFTTGPGSFIAQPVGLTNNSFVISNSQHIFCYDIDGEMIWEMDGEDHPSISADFDGNIFVADNEYLRKLDASGNELWRYDPGNRRMTSKVSIAPDGTLYFGDAAKRVVALTPGGILKHTTQLDDYCDQLTVDDEGFVYASCNYYTSLLYRISPAGEIVASRSVNGIASNPALVDSAYVYWSVGTGSGLRVYRYHRDDLSISAISPAMNGGNTDELTLATNDRYFLTSWENSPDSYLYGRTNNGQPLWVFNPREIQLYGHMIGSPLILPNGNLVASTRDSYGGANLFFIKEDAVAMETGWFTQGCNFLRNSCLPPQPCTTANFDIKIDTLHYGIVPLNTPQQKSIWLYNSGVENLDISYTMDSDIFSLISSPTCTVAPGDSTLLIVQCLIPSQQNGIHEAVLEIQTNDPDFPTKEIHCRAQSTLEGTLLWSFDADCVSSPAVDGNGTVYLVNGANLKAILPSGVLKWETSLYRNYYRTDNVTILDDDSSVLISPAELVDSTGVIIFNEFPGTWNTTEIALTSQQDFVMGGMSLDDPGLFYYNLDGEKLWENTTLHRMTDAPVIDENDHIYFQTYANSMLGAFYCFDTAGNQVWMQNVDTGINSPVIGRNQRLYYLLQRSTGESHSVLVCTDYSGSQVWECEVPSYSQMSGTSPVIDAEDNLYFGSWSGFLASVSAEGEVNWIYHTYSGISSTPAIGANGCSYFGADDGKLYALNPEGTLRWSYQTSAPINTGIAISPDGVIYCTNDDGRLLAIRGDCGGLADSPWPMMHQNTRHTNRLPHAFITSSQQHTVPTPRITLTNYPNPFNPSTEISFSLSIEQYEPVSIEIFNVKGQKVKKLEMRNDELEMRSGGSATGSVTWDGTDSSGHFVSSGVYLYRLVVDNKSVAQKKMMLIK